MKWYVLVTAATLCGTMLSCQKGGVGDDNGNDPGNNNSNKLKDSTLLYTRDAYLWYNQIPANFNARQYADPDAIMEAIRPYSIETGFTNPVDRWSFAVTRQQWDDLSSGIGGDFGMGVFFLSNTDLRVSYVEKASPAGKATIKRSWQIKSINNKSNLTPNDEDLIINAVYLSNSATFTFGRPAGADTTITLTAGTYLESPIYVDSVYQTGPTKTGYMVLNSFLGDTTKIKNEFQRIFTRFQTEGVQDVVVDLRYNGGGYVRLQDELANYLVPTGNNGQIMEDMRFNDKLGPQFNRTTRFQKKGSLNINRLFVIVTQNTASASELLINSLKPFMNVQLIGPSRTHGKAVGYFGIEVMDWVIFPVSFRTLNKNGEGNYFNGLAVNNQVMDGLDKGWGDVNERCLASALRYITTGSYARLMAPDSREGLTTEVEQGNNGLGRLRFKGSVVKEKLR